MACQKFYIALQKIFHNVSVEPTLFLYSFSYFIFFPTVQDMLFTKICYERFSDFNFCAYNSSAKDNASVQKTTSQWTIFLTLSFLIPAAVMTLITGSWSDRFGRKVPLLIPMIGFIIALSGFIAYSFYLTKWPVQVFIILMFLSGCFGGELTILAMSISYITNISEPDRRIFRLSILESMVIIGATAGVLISGILTKNYGHSAGFIASTCSLIVCFLYTFFCVKNVQSQSDSTGTIFNLKAFVEAAQCCLKFRPENKRTHILLSFTVIGLSFSSIGIEQAIMYLFVKDKPLLWNFEQYATMTSINHACSGFALLVILPIFRSYLKFSDAVIGVIGGISNIIKLIILGISTNTTLLYTSLVLGCLGILQLVSARSILSKSVEPHEEGKLFSVASILQCIVLVTMSAIGNSLWPIIRNYYKGLLFEASTILLVISSCIMIFLYVNIKKINSSLFQKLTESETDVNINNENSSSS